MSPTAIRHQPPASAQAPAVAASGLRYAYGDYVAVDDVDVTVPAGQVFALLGTNGAGKTTTLELLQGHRRPLDGDVEVLGHDPQRDREAIARRTGVMLQEAGFIDELSVVETVRLWQRLSSRPDDPARVLRRVGLGHRSGVAVEQLSGGERRRLDVALAVWGDPDLIVLDEPTTGLDPESRRSMWGLVDDLRDGGTTVVLTTHYLEEAEALADTLAIMHAGRIAVSGTLDEVLASRPALVSAELDEACLAIPPTVPGRLSTTPRGDGRVHLEIASDDLQRDLLELLTWADRHGVALSQLRGTPATLDDVFHAVRAEHERVSLDDEEPS